MSAKDAKEMSNEETKLEGPQGFAKMCRQMISGGMPDRCGTEMRGMMSQWMAAFQAEPRK